MGGEYREKQEGSKKKKKTIGVPLSGDIGPFYMVADSAFRTIVDAFAALHADNAGSAMFEALFVHGQGRTNLDAPFTLHALLFVDPHVKDVYFICQRLHGAERA